MLPSLGIVIVASPVTKQMQWSKTAIITTIVIITQAFPGYEPTCSTHNIISWPLLHPLISKLTVVRALRLVNAPSDWELSTYNNWNGVRKKAEEPFLRPFVLNRRETAQPVPTKAFLQPDKIAAMCMACHDYAHPLPPPFFAGAKPILKMNCTNW